MRSGFYLAVSLLFLGSCTPDSGPLTGGQLAGIREEVSHNLMALTQAMNDHDPDEVFSFYRQDESFYYLGCTSVLFGWGTFSSRVRPYYANQTDVTFQREIMNIQVLSPTVAVAASRGSSSDAEHLFWTQVLQKNEEGRWLITYEHESWPGCPVPRGPHMGTTGEPGEGTTSPESGIQGS